MKRSKLLFSSTALSAVCLTIAPLGFCSCNNLIKIEEIIFSEDYSWIEVGALRDFSKEVKILPENASDKSLLWEISNQSPQNGTTVAKVDPQTGVVIGISAGYAKLTCTSKDGSQKSTDQWIIVGEYKDWTSFTIDATASFVIGETKSLNPKYEPSDATVQFAQWTSSNPNVATVTEYGGDVTAIAEGTTTITATPYYYNPVTKIIELKKSEAKTCAVTVGYSAPAEVKLDTTSRIVKSGNEFVVSPTVLPASAKQETYSEIYQETELLTKVSGKVNAFKAAANVEGTAYIAFFAASNPSIYAACKISIVKDFVAVNSISITDISPSMKVGETWQPTVEVLPDNATDKDYYFTTTNEDIAAPLASDPTKIEAKSAGTVTITVNSTDGVHSGTCDLTVTKDPVKVEDINLPPQVSVKTGSQSQTKTLVLPRDADDKTLKWTSSDTSVATVNESTGEITALTVGTTTITAAAQDGSGITKSSTLNVADSVTDIQSISIPSTFTKRTTQTEQSTIQATINPTAASTPYLYWESSDESVAVCEWDSSSSTTCTIKGVSSGTCIVTAYAANGTAVSNSCQVTINPDIPLSLTLSETEKTMDIGQMYTLRSTIYPLTADQSVTWTSSNEEVATVINGTVKALSKGETTITCKSTADPNLTATCKVTVYTYTPVEAIALVDPTQQAITMELEQTMELPKIKVTPEDASFPEMLWTSSDDSKLKIDNWNGTMQAIGTTSSGSTVKLTGTSVDNISLSIVCDVTINNPAPTSIKVNYAPQEIAKGSSDQIKCEILPSSATQTVNYESLTPEIMSVDQNTGAILALLAGEAKIKCYSAVKPTVFTTVDILVTGTNRFSEDTWEHVCQYANEGLDSLHRHYAKDCEENTQFPGTLIGCQKHVKINKNQHLVKVIGEQHDTLADGSGKAPLTFELFNLLTGYGGAKLLSFWDSTNNYDYTHSILRNNLNGTSSDTIPSDDLWSESAFSMLPEELSANIKTVTKQVATTKDYKVTSYNDKLFPLTMTEMAQSGRQDARVEGTAYQYWTKHNFCADRAKKDCGGIAGIYRLASPCMRVETEAWQADRDGYISGYEISYSYSVSFAFCI